MEENKIRLLALDSKLANLAILRIAQYYINLGIDVGWYEHLFDYEDTDILYISKIFTFTDDVINLPINARIIKGGTGYDVLSKLPIEMESITDIKEAYELLYPEIDYSILFTTRGCVRKCPFCVVPLKEGMIHSVNTTTLNPNGTYIELLDNNFFSGRDWEKRFNYVQSLNQPINFNTGLDCRSITEEQAKVLGELNIKAIHIAWDNLEEEQAVFNGIERMIKYVSPSKITCYVLVGFKQPEIIASDLYRVRKLHEYKITPFAMGYIDFDNPKQERSESVKHFQRYVNKHIFKTVSWDEYGNKFDIERLNQTTIYDFIDTNEAHNGLAGKEERE